MWSKLCENCIFFQTGFIWYYDGHHFLPQYKNVAQPQISLERAKCIFGGKNQYYSHNATLRPSERCKFLGCLKLCRHFWWLCSTYHFMSPLQMGGFSWQPQFKPTSRSHSSSSRLKLVKRVTIHM